MQITRQQAGPRMSKAVVHGDTVYLAGIVAEAPKGKSKAEQAKDILRQIDALLAQSGTDKSKLLSANLWITEWFQGEHLQERLAVPGFLFGRRHKAIAASSSYFNYYVVESPEC